MPQSSWDAGPGHEVRQVLPLWSVPVTLARSQPGVGNSQAHRPVSSRNTPAGRLPQRQERSLRRGGEASQGMARPHT